MSARHVQIDDTLVTLTYHERNGKIEVARLGMLPLKVLIKITKNRHEQVPQY